MNTINIKHLRSIFDQKIFQKKQNQNIEYQNDQIYLNLTQQKAYLIASPNKLIKLKKKNFYLDQFTFIIIIIDQSLVAQLYKDEQRDFINQKLNKQLTILSILFQLKILFISKLCKVQNFSQLNQLNKQYIFYLLFKQYSQRKISFFL
ncbi:hypothetical protein ABPG72_002716 [Tetrahymena utriculariae]